MLNYIVEILQNEGENQMAGVKKCPKCGNMISEGGSFCPFCGNSINDKVIIQGKNPEPYNEQDEIQRKYRKEKGTGKQKRKPVKKERKSGTEN